MMLSEEQKKAFDAGDAAGFTVAYAKQYYENMDGTKCRMEQHITMPYTFQGEAVYAVTITNVDHSNGRDALRNTPRSDLYTASDRRIASGDVLTAPNGQSVRASVAAEQAAKYASAASELPHIFTYEEFMAARNFYAGAMGVRRPTSDDYVRYLEKSIIPQLRNRSERFTGRYQTEEDVRALAEEGEALGHEYAWMHHDQIIAGIPQPEGLLDKLKGLFKK